MAKETMATGGLQASRRPTGAEGAQGVNQLVTAKATQEEAEAFRRWLLAAAQAAADAGKEGDFLGFGGEQLSAGDQRMLDQVRAALEMA
jgi:hypothetical protein